MTHFFTAAVERKTDFIKTDIEESTTTVEVENMTVESIITDEEISKTDVEISRKNEQSAADDDDDAAKCLLIDMHSSSSTSARPDDAVEISRKNEQVDNIILNTSVQRDIKDSNEETAVVVTAVTATTTPKAYEQPEKTIQGSADVEITNSDGFTEISPKKSVEDQIEMDGEEKQEIIEEPPLPKSSGYNLDFLDKLDDPNFNPFETKAKVQNFDDALPSSTTTPLPASSVSGSDEKLRQNVESKSKVSSNNDDSITNSCSKPTAIVKPQSEMKQEKVVENNSEEKKKKDIDEQNKSKEVEEAKKDEKPKKKPLPPKPWLKKKKKLPSNSDDTSKTEDSVSGKLVHQKITCKINQLSFKRFMSNEIVQ